MRKINCFVLLIIILMACSKAEEPTDLSEKEVIVKDIDGNEYTAVTIDGTTWLWENLRSSRYRNGTPIPEITDNESWASTNSGAYSWFNNIDESEKGHGKLYNWEAATCCNICPEGYRLPTLKDFYEVKGVLSDYFCDDPLECLPYISWITKAGTGEGMRDQNGRFPFEKEGFSGFWTIESINDLEASIFKLEDENRGLASSYAGRFGESKQNKKAGLSIKCVKIQ
jgi:uncharacterized protein (TIGR02145 family)